MIDINMPDNCDECRFNTEYGFCKAMPDNFCGNTDDRKKPEWCPLKEQEPKEVKYKSTRIDFIDEYFEGECPSCRSFIDEHSNRNFCGYCGQELKWE